MRAALALLACVTLPGQTWPGEADVKAAIEEAIAQDRIPGAVFETGGADAVRFRRAYGSRALVPAREPMTEDTIFDAASLTKVVATTSAIMKLFEQGRVRMEDPVTAYLPGFQNGSSEITVRQLLTHFSGLRPDVDLEPAWSGYETGIRKALVDKPTGPPGARFVYSDINFILLGEIVRVRGGVPLPEFARTQVFEPLGMRDSRFQPPASLRSRIAPTEQEKGMSEPLRGVVHDPTTRYMNGVAGHAGLFTTAADLGRFARMILNGGIVGQTRLFRAETIRYFTEPHSPPDQPSLRGLGWDILTRYSSNRGELFPLGSFGHTGFTGTSLWIDPSSKTYVILMTNSVHPRRRPAVSSLRSRVATITAAHVDASLPRSILPSRPSYFTGKVLTGLDLLGEQKYARLRGKRVGLITNPTGISRDGSTNIALMRKAGITIAGLLSAEHGITGDQDHERIGDSRDPASGLPVYSLYQDEKRTPSPELMKRFDVVVFDMQDIGTRFYTYMCTLVNVMRAAAAAGVPVIVLDRPNPINGVTVEGAVLDSEYSSFVGCLPLPLRHGLTIGEIAGFANGELKIGAKLDVVKMRGWRREQWFDETGLIWVNPSPNIRSLQAALLFPAVAMIEYSRNYSVGRGTDAPFELIGAEWLNGSRLAEEMNGKEIPGIRFYPTRFRPASGPLAGKDLNGVRFYIDNRDAVNVASLGTELAATILKLHPGSLDIMMNVKLLANRKLIDGLRAGTDPKAILRGDRPRTARFQILRRQYLLY